jgi:hypothetical protein
MGRTPKLSRAVPVGVNTIALAIRMPMPVFVVIAVRMPLTSRVIIAPGVGPRSLHHHNPIMMFAVSLVMFCQGRSRAEQREYCSQNQQRENGFLKHNSLLYV